MRNGGQMKRKDLVAKAQELGIESDKLDDFVDFVMNANGTDIENTKKNVSATESKLAETENLLKEANDKLAGFSDYDELKQFKADTQAKVIEKQHTDYLKSQGCKHPELFLNKITWDEAQYNANNQTYGGLEEVMTGFKNDYKDLFENASKEQIPPTPTPDGGNQPERDEFDIAFDRARGIY